MSFDYKALFKQASKTLQHMSLLSCEAKEKAEESKDLAKLSREYARTSTLIARITPGLLRKGRG